MLVSQLTINTTDGERIIKRLAKHWSHKLEITTQDNQTLIPFSDVNQAILSADNEHLFVKLTTDNAESHEKLQGVVLSHINRMAGVEFEANWQEQSA